MLQQKRKFVDIYNMCQSSCPKRFIEMHNVAKKFKKGKQEWENAYVTLGLPPRKLNI
jgi:hypothetical protein